MRNHGIIRALLSAAALLTALSFVAETTNAQKWDKVTDEEWNLHPPADYPEADAVIIFDKGELSITTSQIRLDRHVRMKIFDKSGADEVSSVEITHYDGDKIKLLKAHTILPNGDKKNIKEKFKKEMGQLRTITFAFPNVEDGAILEYRYTLTHERYGFLDPWFFQNDVYTMHSVFSVDLAAGFTYRTTFVNVPEASRTPEREVDTYTWSVDNLPPVHDEPLMGAERSYLTSLSMQLVSYRDSWNNIEFGIDWGRLGKMVSRDIEEYADDDDLIRETAEAVTADAVNQEGQIIDLYEFVRDSIETRSDLSISFFDKDDASKLLKRRHGTAVEKNALLVCLLKTLGIEAYPLMIGTRDYSAFNSEVHQLRQFNHLICCLMTDSSRAATLDAGDRSVAYPHLPPRDLVTGGLLLNGEKSAPVRLSHAARPSGSQITTVVSLKPDGSAVCTTSVCVVGYEMNKYERFLRDSLSQQEMAEEIVESKQAKFTVTEARVQFDVESDSLHFEFVVELPEYATILDNNVFIQSSLVPMWNPFEDDRRFCPVDFKYPFFKHCSTIINLPEGMKVADVPPDVDHAIRGGRYMRRSFWSNRSITVSAMLSIDDAVFMPRQYPQLKELFDLWEDAGTDQIAAVSGE